MFAQLRTIAWLQFRLVKNSATRNLRWLGAFAWALQVGLSIMGCAFITSIAFATGFVTAEEKHAWIILAILDGGVILVLLVRTLMLLAELTEADFIDTGKLLFLPIRLRTLFGINFVVRNASGILLIVVPPLIALCLSLAIIQGPRMLMGIPLGLVTLLAIAAWFGFIREWLLTLGDNRKQALLTTAVFVFSGVIAVIGVGWAYSELRTESQSPIGVSQEKLAALEKDLTPKMESDDFSEVQVRNALLQGNAWIPLGWFPLGVYEMIYGRYRVALAGALGLSLIAVLGIALEYRLVHNRYRGANSGVNTPKKKKKTIPTSKWTRLALPFLSHDWSAYAGLAYLARTRSLTIKSSHWFYGVAAIAASCIPLVADVSHLRGNWWSSVTLYAAAAAIIFFTAALFINVFGQDRSGFQVLVLMPVKRHVYIMCKNVIVNAYILMWIAMLMVPCMLVFRPHPIALVAALLITIQAQLTLTMIGNGLSIAFPFRLKEGPLDQPAQPLAAILPSFLFILSLPIVFTPMILTAMLDPALSWLWKLEGAWISFICAVLFLVPTLCVYAVSIPATAAFLASREMRMLEILASDRE